MIPSLQNKIVFLPFILRKGGKMANCFWQGGEAFRGAGAFLM